MPVRIPCPNMAVTSVDKRLCFLVTCYFSGTPDRFLLGIISGRGALTAFRFGGPAFRVRHDMLIAFAI